jgi:hypothetical protein
VRQRRWPPSAYPRLAGAGCLLFAIWLCLPGRSPFMRQTVSSMSFVLAPAVGSWRCLIAAAALATWGLGSALWVYEDLVLMGGAPFPSPADAAWLLFPILGIGALLSQPAMPRRAMPAARLLLDGIAAAAAMLLIARLGPINAVGSHVHGLGHWVITAYPSLDVLAGSVVLVALDRLRAGPRHPGALLAAALAGACATDLAYALLATHGAYAPGGPLDLGWAVSFLLVGYAAGRPVPAERPATLPQHRLLPTLPAALAMAVLLLSGRLSSGLDPLMLILLFVLSVALAARQHLLTTENRALHESLELAACDEATRVSRT